jgi:NADPH:quinone reductase-like Zn-dependent oxidoreductase/acyl carrier protein
MWAMGLLPPEALEDGFAGMTIGMECAGTVVAAGEGVSRFSVGDRVMAFAPAAFSTHLCVDARAVMALPASIGEVAGATIPVAFLTAYYALVELARLKGGETVLVHGGAGGVGLAALQVARLCGARVIATAGSREKRALLTALGAEHVLDSRSLAFVPAVEKLTGGAGVDVVLNSLSGDAMERSIGLLKPFGRFLELGKRDYYADRKIGLRPFRRNISYFGIDADQLLLADPALTERLFDRLTDLFAGKKLHPLPHRVFNHGEIGAAFRLMQGSGHIGKIVVTPPRSGRDAIRWGERAPLRMDPGGIHLVVGGIGGFGLAAADWLVEKGARRIALCSRRGVADEATRERMARWRAQGVETTILSCDVTDRARTEVMLSELRAQAPLKSVIHAAMVLDDGLLPNLSRKRNRPVVETKALGAEHLDALTRGDDLDHFILFSSVTTLIGNIGQANYVAANGYLEGLARRRRGAGLPALAVAFGPIGDAGILASQTALGERLAKRLGDTAMPAREAFRHVEAYIGHDGGSVDESSVVIAHLDWQAVSRLRIAKTSLFDPVRRSRRGSPGAEDAAGGDLAALLADKPDTEAEAIVFGIVAQELAEALQIPLSSVSPAMVLKDIGLDSLMAVELGMSLEKRTGLEITLGGLSEKATIGELAGKLLAKARRTDATEDAEALDADFRRLASRHEATG